MSESSHVQDRPNAPSREQLLEKACAELEEAIRNGSGSVEDLLQRYSLLAGDADAIVDLAYREFAARIAMGQPACREEYYTRFPQNRRELEEQFEIHAFLAEVTGAGKAADAAPTNIGTYDIETEVGRGAAGIVYRARHRVLDRIVALKILSPSVMRSNESERFLTEARAVARLQHPNIVQLFEVGESGGRPYLAFEFVGGGSLAGGIAQEPMPQRASASLMSIVARAVAYSHSLGILHRDLKPSNILLTLQGVPKVADFGLSKLIDHADMSMHSGWVIGTPQYMAPEQAVAEGTVGVAADVYGLGAILYELLTGRPPFRAETQVKTLYQVISCETVPVVRLQPDVASDLATICEKCLSKNPAHRYTSASDLADDLDRFLAGEPIRARPPNAIVRIKKWALRHPLHVMLAAVVLLAAIALTAMGTWSNVQLRHAATEADHQRRVAEKSEADARAQLETARRLSYSIQLGQVNEIWRTDPFRAMQLLSNPEICPIERRDFAWGLFHHLCRSDRIISTQNIGGVTGLAIVGDQQRLVVSGPKNVQTWSLSAGRPKLESSIDTAASLGVATTSDGDVLAVGTRGPTVILERVSSDENVLELTGHKDKPAYASVSGDGKLLATGGADRIVCIWRYGQNRPVATIRCAARIRALALSANGRALLISVVNGDQQSFDVSDPEKPISLFSTQLAGGDATSAVALSHDGLVGAVADTKRHVVQLFDARSGIPQYLLSGHTGLVEALEFSRDGRILASGGRDHSIRLWNVSSGDSLGALACPGQHVRVIRIASDGLTILAGGDAGDVQIWGLAEHIDLDRIRPEPQSDSKIISLACSPDGTMLATGASDGRVELRDLASLQSRASFPVHKSSVIVIAYSPNGRLLATGGRDGRVIVIETKTGRVVKLDESAATVRSVAFSPDGAHIAAGANDGTVRVWDCVSFKEVTRISGNHRPADGIAYSSDGRWIAIGYEDAQVKVIDAKSLTPKATLTGHHDRVLIVRFSPDSRTLVTGGLDRTVRLWNVPEFTNRATLQWRDGYPFCATFTSNGRTLALGGGTRSEPHIAGEVLLCDAQMGHTRATLSRQIGPAAFSPDDRTLITVGESGHLNRWAADPPDAPEAEQ